MNSSTTLELTDQPADADVDFLHHALYTFNRALTTDDDHRPLATLLRTSTGELIGGLLGGTYWNWLYIEILWVAETHRDQGHGRVLLAAAEREAIHRGCHHAHLNTHDFQAVEFYRKQGYTIAGQLEDLPPGHIRFLMKKDLVP